MTACEHCGFDEEHYISLEDFNATVAEKDDDIERAQQDAEEAEDRVKELEDGLDTIRRVVHDMIGRS